MRIIGNIEHPVLKISVFRNDNRISIKFENAQYEQIFKMRESITNVAEAQRFADAAFCKNVETQFAAWHLFYFGAWLQIAFLHFYKKQHQQNVALPLRL